MSEGCVASYPQKFRTYNLFLKLKFNPCRRLIFVLVALDTGIVLDARFRYLNNLYP
jgi:hypothetical protein